MRDADACECGIKGMKTKREIRETQKAWRHALDSAWLHSASHAVARQVVVLDVYRDANSVCLFSALPGEVLLDDVESDCRANGKRVLLPAYNEEENDYGFKEWPADGPLRAGPYHVLEPDGQPFVSLDDGLVLVPGLAFDVRGGRIGFGAGYYDRLLGMRFLIQDGLCHLPVFVLKRTGLRSACRRSVGSTNGFCGDR
jgi:5-formyltetrahydrofolate cyclo-ligase